MRNNDIFVAKTRNYDIFVAKTRNYDIFVAKIYDYALIDSFWGFPWLIDSPTLDQTKRIASDIRRLHLVQLNGVSASISKFFQAWKFVFAYKNYFYFLYVPCSR